VAINVTAFATDNVGVTRVDFYATPPSAGPPVPIFLGNDTTAPYGVGWDPPNLPACGSQAYTIHSEAFDACLNKGISSGIPIVVFSSLVCPLTGQAFWTSHLDVPGGSGRVTLNDASVAVGRGRVQASARLPRGESRVEAELLNADGKPGVWRFELGPYVAAGSVRVLSGEPVHVSDSAVVFRLTGKAGERVSFTFRTPD
jgi:hypothetical protein